MANESTFTFYKPVVRTFQLLLLSFDKYRPNLRLAITIGLKFYNFLRHQLISCL